MTTAAMGSREKLRTRVVTTLESVGEVKEYHSHGPMNGDGKQKRTRALRFCWQSQVMDY